MSLSKWRKYFVAGYVGYVLQDIVLRYWSSNLNFQGVSASALGAFCGMLIIYFVLWLLIPQDMEIRENRDIHDE